MMIFRSWSHIDHVGSAKKKKICMGDNCKRKFTVYQPIFRFASKIKSNDNIKAQEKSKCFEM